MSASQTIAATTPPPPLAEPARAPAATILLVEDDRAIRRYLQVILQRAGYEVIVASDGLEAMKAALDGSVHAVITDAIMPHLGGHELCRFLRRHPKLKHLPVLLLSGVERPEPHAEETEPADAYLSKPVGAQELTNCLARLLNR